MSRTSPKRNGTGKRAIGPKTRFAPDLLALEDRSVPALIYVDPVFTGVPGGNPNQDFNAGGQGPLGTVTKADLTFVATGNSAGIFGAGKFATSDITTAFNAARDNPGGDTILLAVNNGTYDLDNSQGKSTLVGGFNDNTYFFNFDPLSILGSGTGQSRIRPTVSTFDPGDKATLSDPVFAVRLGANFVGSDFTLDGAGVAAGVGIGVSSGTNANLTKVALLNFVGLSGATTNGATFGYGLAVNPNAGGFVTVTDGTFSGNARAGISVLDSDAQVIGGKFTGRGAGNLVDYGVQALGSSNVYVTGATLTNYLGKAGVDNTESTALLAAQDVDPVTQQPIAGVARMLAVGNKITGNTVGVGAGSITSGAAGGDLSVVVANFNDLSGNVRGLDATNALAFGVTGVDSGIDGRFNFFGGTGPDRGINNPLNGLPNDTAAFGDEQLNLAGTGSMAVGNVRIAAFRGIAVPPTIVPNPTFVANPADTPGSAKTARAPFLVAAPPSTLTIYVNGQEAPFTDANNNGKADQVFNPSGVGPLGTQGTTPDSVQFVATGTPYASLGYAAGSTHVIAVPDLTTAFDIARDNGGKDTILLAASSTVYTLQNANGQSATLGGGFNDNTYFFSGAGNDLTIRGSGAGNSIINPLTSTVDPADPLTRGDPAFAVRQGADFAASDFTFDGSTGQFGGGIGISGGSDATITRVALRNFNADAGPVPGGATNGFGLYINPNAGGFVTVAESSFSGNGRQGIGVLDSDLQVLGSTFTGRGAGDLVDYGVQALGTSRVYVSGSFFNGYEGKATFDKTESAGILVSQDVDPATGKTIDGGGQLLAVGNAIVGNRVGVAVGSISAAGTDTSTADVRFNNLSGNGASIDASGAAAGGKAVNAPNNWFGAAAGPTVGSPLRANGGNISTVDFRPVVTPVAAVANGFGTAAAPTLAAAAPLAAQGYVSSPQVASAITVNSPAPQATGAVTFTLTFAEPLVVPQSAQSTDRVAILQSLLSASYTALPTPANGSPATQVATVGVPTIAGDGKTATVVVTPPAGVTQGVLRLTVQGNAVALSTGNLVTGPTGTSPAGNPAFTSAGTTVVGTIGAVTLAPIANRTFNVNGPAQNVGTTVTVSAGRTVASVTATASPNNLVTITRVVGSPNNAPQFTVTPIAGAVGSGVVTITATDSDGNVGSTAFAVQVGTGVAPTITGLPDQTIPFAGSTGPLTVNVAGGNQPLTVTATTSNPGVATVAVTGSGASRTVVVTANPALTTGGSTAISLRVTDAQGLSSVVSFNVTVAAQRVRRFAAGVGPGSAPVVQVYGQNGEKLFGFTAFELSFTGGVSVATGDVNGDGVDDIIAGASVGGGPRVRVIDGLNGGELANFYAFESTSRAGVFVAAGKVINTGVDAKGYYREQIVVGAAEGGGPRVSTFDVGPGKGNNPTQVNNFFAYEETFRNGATVGTGDLNGDGLVEIITGSGIGGGPRVRAFTATGASAGVDFFAFDSSLRTGVNVAAGVLDGSGKASIIAGTGPNGGSQVRVFSNTGTQQAQFVAYADAPAQAVRVGTGQFNASGPESIITGPAVGGGPVVKVFSGANPSGGAVFADFAFEPPFRGGIFVG